MKELGMVLIGCFAIGLFFSLKIYPELEYSGYSSNTTCTGECYEEYVRINGTPAQIEIAKRALAEGDPFSSIRSLWAGCAACHGADGGGGVGPMLAGQSSNDIIEKKENINFSDLELIFKNSILSINIILQPSLKDDL